MTQRAPELHTTEDGRLTLYAPTFGEHYHSTHGAVQESEHIYLGLALRERMSSWQEGDAPLRLFEVGFGTGLNALLSWREAEERHIPLQYYSIEKFPITPEVYEALHYEGLGQEREVKDQLLRLHMAPWDEAVELSPFFTLHKLRGDLWGRLLARERSSRPTVPRARYVAVYSGRASSWSASLAHRASVKCSVGASPSACSLLLPFDSLFFPFRCLYLFPLRRPSHRRPSTPSSSPPHHPASSRRPTRSSGLRSA